VEATPRRSAAKASRFERVRATLQKAMRREDIPESYRGQGRDGLWSLSFHRFRGCAMTLHFSDEELDLLFTLAAPIDRRQRPEFLRAVAAELEVSGQAGAVGIGTVHRVAAQVQQRFFEPPELGESKYRR
jgi:hypothetical protein